MKSRLLFIIALATFGSNVSFASGVLERELELPVNTPRSHIVVIQDGQAHLNRECRSSDSKGQVICGGAITHALNGIDENRPFCVIDRVSVQNVNLIRDKEGTLVDVYADGAPEYNDSTVTLPAGRVKDISEIYIGISSSLRTEVKLRFECFKKNQRGEEFMLFDADEVNEVTKGLLRLD